MSTKSTAAIGNVNNEKKTKETVKAPTGPVDKRIYIGGLHPSTTADQIVDRFSKFGKVSDVAIAKNTDNECRGFAHMTIHTESKKWESCMSVYNGAKWRGQELKLEEAKTDWQERKRLRQEKILEQEEKKKKRLLRWNGSDGFHAKDMTPVTDNNMGTRKGWKRGRYGRAIAVMRLKKNDGTTFVFEPTHYKNNLTKLYNIGVRMKPVNQLITKVEQDSSDEEDDWQTYSNKNKELEEHEEEDNADASTTMTDDEKRRAAMDRMFEDQRIKKGLISKALAAQSAGVNHTTFDNDDDDNIKVDDAFEMDLDAKQNDIKNSFETKKWMFDSDEDDNSDQELDIKINPVLEGEAGRKRLELQKRFKGDERFKLGQDFIDEDEQIAQPKNLGDDITQGLNAEKDQAMNVLRAMFGEDKVDSKPKHQSSTWASSDRFDPDADDFSKYLAESSTNDTTRAPTTNDTDEDDKDEDDNEENDDFNFFAQPRKAESAMPIVSTEKHFEVNTDLKPLFGDAEEAPFTLFGGNDDDYDDTEEPSFTNQTKSLSSFPNDEISPSFTHKKAEGRLGLGVMFFFHLDDPALMKKSCYAYDSEGVFQEKTEERDSYENKWRTQRPVIREILKKRYKNAVKNQKRRSTKPIK
ncbi:hypothetical protein [Parasitella parasitica]|uniref:RRM domain-containing protein n=1 Tax=Parasitella parasitica TaxID=35722 RepID=A0A0B7MSI2_9FUNG|nr:hypothetical protein [Parasitella parasitica]